MTGDIGIGKIIEHEAFRDAIHIAVAPVEAAEELNPGERVGLVGGRAMATDLVNRYAKLVDPMPITMLEAIERQISEAETAVNLAWIEGHNENVAQLLKSIDQIYTAATLSTEEKEDFLRMEPERFLRHLKYMAETLNTIKNRVRHQKECKNKDCKCSDDPPTYFENRVVEEEPK